MKIGVVLAGGANKGAYEIGAVKALTEQFSRSEIAVVSASSIGVLSAYALCTGKIAELEAEWEELSSEGSRRFFLKFASNAPLIGKIRSYVREEDTLEPELFATVWNFTGRQVEYIRLNDLSCEERKSFLQASLAFPVFAQGVRIRGNVYLDGALLDNIPVYPLLNKELDYIVCVYFENKNFLFETDTFDRRVIKINGFPSTGPLSDTLVYDPAKAGNMVEYGYRYTKMTLKTVFSSDDPAEIARNMETLRTRDRLAVERRILTADSCLRAMNRLMGHMAKRKIKGS